jgi:altronate dehydratase
MIQLNEKDNVAVAVEDCIPGQEVAVKAPSSIGDYTVLSVSEIPFGHKCALRDIKAGEIIVKYGRPIGAPRRTSARARSSAFTHRRHARTRRQK